MRQLLRLSTSKQSLSILLGLIVFFLVLTFGRLDDGNPRVTYTLAIALLMAIWWVTEAVPLAVTSLIPVALFPLLGIMNGKDVSSTYFNHVIFLFIGGFIVAIAMQKWDLHKRIALKILMFTGLSPARIMLGFMLAAGFLSMWISNTATCMMMVPILLSIMSKLEDKIDKEVVQKYSIGLLLGVAHGASIGGIATLVGTPPNLSFARIFQVMFPEAPEISFAQWLFFAFPIAVVIFIFCVVYLYYVYKPKKNTWNEIDKSTFRREYEELGPVTYEQRIIFINFIALAFLWLFRTNINIGNFVIPGWSNLFNNPEYINDGTVGVIMGIVLFMIPAKDKKLKFILNLDAIAKIPWHIVLLFGGGFALASGFKESGLSEWFGYQLQWVVSIHPILVMLVICLVMTFLTELTSNTATTEMLLPILAGLSVSVQINPLLFMLPATLSASMAFMLPVATPPNAIIFGTNRLTVMQMAKTGFTLNIFGAIVITLATYFFSEIVFGFDMQLFPDWAKH